MLDFHSIYVTHLIISHLYLSFSPVLCDPSNTIEFTSLPSDIAETLYPVALALGLGPISTNHRADVRNTMYNTMIVRIEPHYCTVFELFLPGKSLMTK